MKSELKVEERFGQSNSFVILKAAIGLFTPSSSEWEIQDYPKKMLVLLNFKQRIFGRSMIFVILNPMFFIP